MMLKRSMMLSAIFSLTLSLYAETLTVTSNADSGAGTLRQLMADAADGDTIVIPAGMKITLESVLPLPNKSLDFVGGKGSSVSGNGTVPVFSYQRQWNYNLENRFAFSGVTIEDGFTASLQAAGINVNPTHGGNGHLTLVLNDCTFLRNKNVSSSCAGGALGSNNENFDLYATNCVFSGNCAMGSVAGVTWNALLGQNVVFSHCTMSENGTGLTSSDSANLGGGLIYGSARNLLLDGCTIVGNRSTIKNSGCVYRSYTTDKVPNQQSLSFRMTDCFVSNNLAKTEAGLFNIVDGTNLIERTHFINNTGDNLAIAMVGACIVDFKNSIIEGSSCLATDKPADYNRYGLFAYTGTTNALLGCAHFGLEGCALKNNCFDICYLMKCYYNGGDFSMKRCQVEGNKTGYGGWISMAEKNSTVISECSFINNSTNGITIGASSDTAVRLRSGSVVSNCTFVGNNHEKIRGLVSGALVKVYHCTIVSNVAPAGYGPYLYSSMSVSPIVENSVIADNSPMDIVVEKDKPYEGIRGNALGIGNWVDAKLTRFADNNLVTQTCALLKFDTAPAENRSKIKLLDGTCLKTLAFAKDSPLRDASVAVVPGAVTDARGRKRDAKPDIGSFEYVVIPGLTLYFR